jgi:ribonuclease-3
MEEEPVMAAPDPQKLEDEQQNFIIEQGESNLQEVVATPEQPVSTEGVTQQPTDHDEFSLDDITATPQEKSREDIIAEAEAAAFADE